MLQAFFGVRITVLYSNGAKMRMRACEFKATPKGFGLTRVEWQRPIFSGSREPLFMNVDKIDAIWQGRA